MRHRLLRFDTCRVPFGHAGLLAPLSGRPGEALPHPLLGQGRAARPVWSSARPCGADRIYPPRPLRIPTCRPAPTRHSGHAPPIRCPKACHISVTSAVSRFFLLLNPTLPPLSPRVVPLVPSGSGSCLLVRALFFFSRCVVAHEPVIQHPNGASKIEMGHVVRQSSWSRSVAWLRSGSR